MERESVLEQVWTVGEPVKIADGMLASFKATSFDRSAASVPTFDGVNCKGEAAIHRKNSDTNIIKVQAV